jgi:hypothetical protein
MALVNFASQDVSVEIPRQPKKMITVSESEGKTKVEINSSSLSVIQECLRKAQYSLLEKWKSETESPATVFGSAVHKAMEIFYSAPAEEREMIPLEELEIIAATRPERDWSKEPLLSHAVYEFAKRAEILSVLPDTDKRSLVNGAWILHHYFKSYLNDPYVIYEDASGPFIEREMTFRIYEDDSLIIDYFGTVDAVKVHRDTGHTIGVDYKTTSSLMGYGGSGNYFEKEKPNSQYTGYLLALREAYKLDLTDFCVDIIEVKARPKTARGSGPSFPRQITSRNEDDFEEFRETVVKSVRDYLAAIESKSWPIGPVSACNLWGGCTYKQVCASPKSLRENILTAKFKRE